MAKPTNTKHVPGIGRVITSAEEFSDFDEVGGDRFSDREPEAEPEDDEEDIPDDGGDTEWSPKPWMRDQGAKHPHTVREDAPKTEILNLSVAEDLARWNELQASAHVTGGPALAFTSCHQEFHAGVWHLYVTYSSLSYQKI